MANKSLTDLTARTATADSDLIHVNSGGTDYKETKEYFVDDLAQRASFNNTSDIKTQVGALSRSNKLYYGICNSYGHQTETGSPINANFYITVHVNSSTSMCVELIVIGSSGRRFQAFQNAGTWTAWEELPARSEITSLNNSLTNSLTCDAIFDKKNIPSTATQYSCNWQDYNFLIIQAVQYGNKRANIFIPYASFYGTNSGNRPQIYDPLAQCTYEVYQNGSGKIYASCNAPTSAIGLIIYGLAKR